LKNLPKGQKFSHKPFFDANVLPFPILFLKMRKGGVKEYKDERHSTTRENLIKISTRSIQMEISV